MRRRTGRWSNPAKSRDAGNCSGNTAESFFQHEQSPFATEHFGTLTARRGTVFRAPWDKPWNYGNGEPVMSTRVPTPDEIRAWPVTIDVPTAGRAFGVGRDESYRLAREGHFPVPVLHLGRYLRVTRAAVLAALGIGEHSPAHTDTT